MAIIRRLAVMVLAAALLVTGSQFLLPKFVEGRIESGLQRSLGDVRIVRADIRANPAIVLLGGRMNAVNLDIRRVALGDLMVDAVLLDGRNIKIDMPRLLSGRGVKVTSADRLRATFVISEDDLNQYFWAKVNNSHFFHVALTRGQAVLRGKLNLLGRVLDVRVAGVFKVADGTSVSYVPQEVTVEDTKVPQFLLDMIAKEWAVTLPLDQDAIPMQIDDLLVENGQLFVYGTGVA